MPFFVAFDCNKIGAENLVKYLISKGANVNTRDKFNATPLHVCGKLSGKSFEIF